MANHNTNMSISLPLGMKQLIQEEVRKGYYGTPSDYIRSIIREDLKRRDQEKLEQMLLDGLDSGKPIEMTPQKYKKLRQDLRAQALKR
jgi:antitoxin ParD1/3/4